MQDITLKELENCSLNPSKCQVILKKSITLVCTEERFFVCISPWNFPLAIFTGQILAALVTGNTVIAKPAEVYSNNSIRGCKITA
ncbi:MAG: aldehyde dehydrogenase family protein [Candidatus Midichloria sp.]